MYLKDDGKETSLGPLWKEFETQACLDYIDSMYLDDNYVPPPSQDIDSHPTFFDSSSGVNPDPGPPSAASPVSIPSPDNSSTPDLFVDASSQPTPDSGLNPFIDIVNGTFRPSVLIEDCDRYLAIERSLHGELCFDIFPLYEDIDKPLDVMYEADKFWNTVGGSTALEYWNGYENGKPCLDNDEEPITTIVNNPKSLRSTIFLTKPDEHVE